MPDLIRPALRNVRSKVFDSALWDAYRPRPDDIVVATFPKCGTTWTQRILGMLLTGDAAPAPIVAPWPDFRHPPVEMTAAMAARMADSLPGRRQFKSHLPYDALPVYEGVRFIHVARDGRDAAMSMHNHMVGFLPESVRRFNANLAGDPRFADDPTLDTPEDPGQYFGWWLRDGGGAYGDPGASYFHLENSYWAARREPRLLLVHYNDLKADLEGEIRRMAAFLEIEVPDALLPRIVEAARFETMREQGDAILPHADRIWDGGSRRFLHKGTNGRWRDVARPEDLALYEAEVGARFSPALAAWLEHGRLGAGDPALAPD